MYDSSVELCGIRLRNPLIAASGTAAFGMEFERTFGLDKIGGISLKAVTGQPRKGNPVPRVAETPAGMLNAVGLENPGVDAFVNQVFPAIKGFNCALIANVAGSTQEEYVDVARQIQALPVAMIELNISCPNVHEGGAAFGSTPAAVETITAAVRAVVHKPLMVKLTPNCASIADCARAAEAAGADCVSLINTLTGMMIDVRTRRPILANVTGGLSGPAVKPVALRMVHEVYRAVKIPIVGMGGIQTGEDVAAFMLAGATAVQVGTAQLCDPWAMPRIAQELQAYCQENGVQAVSELTGGLIV